MVQSHSFPKEIQHRMQELVQDIEEHNERYYLRNDPTIADVEYDALLKELMDFEKKFPQWKLPNSPTDRIGTKVDGALPTVVHSVKMMSLDNTYSKDELRLWAGRVEKGLGHLQYDLTAEFKIDGLSCAIIYENGFLSRAITRGDGEIGEDVTHNVRTIHVIPLQLKGKYPKILEVRGEVYMDKNDFAHLNRKRKEEAQELFANPRNAASGTLKLLDSRVTATRKLKFLVHSFGRVDQGMQFKTQWDFLQAAKVFGLPIERHSCVCANVDEVMDICDQFHVMRETLEYEVDGVVIKVNSLKDQEKLGSTLKSPRWAVAFKFPAYQATSVIKEIVVQVGRTGVVTPVAELEPVACAGVTISRATLHNFDEIKRLHVNVGDRVLIERAGDVIPKIVKVVEKLSKGEFPSPKVCPSCGGEIVKEHLEEVAWRCVNPACPKQIERGLIHFASRGAMDIEGLGDVVMVQLINNGLVKDFADIYTLKLEDLLNLDLFAQKKAENLLKAIEKSKSRPLSKFLFGLGISNIGEKAARTLAECFGSLDVLSHVSQEQLEEINEVGPVMAESIVAFFNSARAKVLIKQLKNAGFSFKEETHKLKKNILAGVKFVFTGELEGLSRQKAAEDVEELGADVMGSVSRLTNYVVAGRDAGSKLDKARQLGVKILNQEQFMKLIKELK